MSLDISLMLETGAEPFEAFELNITHNLGAMAKAAGLYEALWHPDLLPIPEGQDYIEAQDVAPTLEAGLAWLKAHPDEAREHDAANGWGTYETFLPQVERYLAACKRLPFAWVEVDR